MSSSPVAFINENSSGGALSNAFSNVHVVGSAWMISSALFTTYSTTKFLKYEPPPQGTRRSQLLLTRPSLLTLLRFTGSLCLGLVLHPNFQILHRIRETLDLAPKFALPAFFLFVANYSNSISLNRIGISLTYTSKCAIPLITLLLTVALDGVEALPKVSVLLTLFPIALGIATASWNNPTFEIVGFLTALLSCTAQSALNVSSKRLMRKLSISGPVAQRAMVAVGLVIASSVSVQQVLQNKQQKEADKKNTLPPAWLTLMAVTAYHVEYVLSFIFVGLVAPITYSACDAVRRLSIIISGHYMFGGPPFTILNSLGIAMALAGALLYSYMNQ